MLFPSPLRGSGCHSLAIGKWKEITLANVSDAPKIVRTVALRCSANGVLVNFDPIYLTTEKLRDQLSEPKERQDNSDNDDQPDDINYAVH
jgi:hypothetical protein